jgi:DNA polymerase III epsilon subunit-like protein
MDEHLLRFDKEKTIVFIDCETLNLCLNKCHNLPWQVSMIKIKGDKEIANKDFYIKWDTHLKISEDAARITRFSQTKMDKKGIPPEEAFPTIQDWLDNSDIIIGHNILGFDIYLIKDLYEIHGADWKPLLSKSIDTNCLARGIKIGPEYRQGDDLLAWQYRMYHTRKKGVRTNLTALGKEYEIDHNYDKLHNALVDLQLNVKIWNKLKWQLEI